MTQKHLFDDSPTFDGRTKREDPEHQERLSSALALVYQLMQDGRWRTLKEISEAVGCTEAGASARIRDLRKEKFKVFFPSREVNSKHVGGGLWKYQVIL